MRKETILPLLTRISALAVARLLKRTTLSPQATMAGEGVTTVEGIERHHPETVHKIDSPVSNPINEN